MSKYYGGFFDFPKEIMKTVKTGIRNKASADAIRAANRDSKKLGGKMKTKTKKKNLKPVDKKKNPGLAKLPTQIRNKMGYMAKGGKVSKSKMKKKKYV